MKRIAIGSSLLIGACSSTPVDETQPVNRACTVSECFFEREIRDFEVIDERTLIVYVGGQRCAYRIELDGTFCDMTFAPEIYFRFPERRADEQRICSYDQRVSVDGGPFTDPDIDDRGLVPGRRSPSRLDPFGDAQQNRFDTRPGQCQVRSIASITDDELLEIYVERGVAPPPPPIGPGKIEVGEQDAGEGASEDESPADGLPAPQPEAQQTAAQ
jgi:hypothetical protein